MDASITKPNLHLISLLILFLVISLHSNASNIKNLAIKDLAYGNHPLQKLDVYQSSNASNAPILFMVHGGAWRRGDKAAKAVVKNKVDRWIAKGFIFISINYRLLPEADPFKQADDVATALKFVQSNASQWGGDPSQIILMGHSAGAHLINILSASSTIKAAHELMPWLATISIDSAVFNVERTMQRKHFRFYDRAFGNDKDYWRSVSP
ncbi:MAG: esterase, partial [Gammaproteobacteria bacterium]